MVGFWIKLKVPKKITNPLQKKISKTKSLTPLDPKNRKGPINRKWSVIEKYPTSIKDKEKFLQAVRVTSNISGFSDVLIEKDYYCSLILKELFQSFDCPLVFKGGTLLNKAYVGFYRLSEDLDFSIADEFKISSRKKRHNIARIAKGYVTKAVKNLSLNFSKIFKGHNENRFHSAEIEYGSLITKDKKTIKIEFGIQEKIWEKETPMAKTILMDPVNQSPVFREFHVVSLSLKEGL